MAILKIFTEGSPILRQKAEPIQKITRRVQKLAKDMVQTMRAADGVGLAAPQVGVSQRLIVVDVGEGVTTLINPILEEAEGSQIDVEGCLSIPGASGYVERAARVVVSGLDETGKSVRLRAEGLMARALQHEIDHLDGILFVDRAKEVVRRDEE